MRARPLLPLLLPSAMTLAGAACYEKAGPVLGSPARLPVPESAAPAPSAAQVAWQAQEMTAFIHFGMNTFTHKEQGDGTDSPTSFNPTAFDARQWVTALRNGGFKEAMLTAKHHDGFCLWPTKCTKYSVAASPFRAGEGDVLREFVDAAHEGNVKVGFALSPYDRHDPAYGTSAYLSVFTCELTELLTNYGPVDEIWLWQAPGSPPFDWVMIRDVVRKLQPQTLLEMANTAAPALANDVRAIALGAPGPLPTPSDQSSLQYPGTSKSASYIPAEAVYSTRPSWFWHATEDAQVKTTEQLLGLYFDTVGRNSLWRLNVPPDTRGLLPDPDVAVLNQLGTAIAALYRTNVAASQVATADSVFGDLAPYGPGAAVDGDLETYWAAAAGATTARLEVDFGRPRAFDLVSLQEAIALGERITEYHLEARNNDVWTTIATGTVIGERKLYQLAPVTADRVALVVSGSRAAPAISELGVYDTAQSGGATSP